MLKECRSHGYFREEFCPHCGSEGKFLLNDEEVEILGRTMAGVLRHFPERYGLEMDVHGWVDLRDFLTAVQIRNRRFRFLRQHHVVGLIETDEGSRARPADGRNPGCPLLPGDGRRKSPSDGSGTPAVRPEDGAPECDLRGGPRGGSSPNRFAGDPRNRCEDRASVRRCDPQGGEDRVHVEGNPERIPAAFHAGRGRDPARVRHGPRDVIAIAVRKSSPYV